MSNLKFFFFLCVSNVIFLFHIVCCLAIVMNVECKWRGNNAVIGYEKRKEIKVKAKFIY